MLLIAKRSLLILVTIPLLSACQSQPLAVSPLNRPVMAQTFTRQAAQPDASRLITEVASAFHEAWRAGRRQPDGSYTPRLKETKDALWIQAHKTNQVDIANTAYPDLPVDWQAENRASAEIAVQEILTRKGQMLSPEFIEQASHVIHVHWLARNAWAKGGDLDVPYAQLPEPEKQKDREALYQAIHKGISLKMVNPQHVSPAVSQAIARMLAKI